MGREQRKTKLELENLVDSLADIYHPKIASIVLPGNLKMMRRNYCKYGCLIYFDSSAQSHKNPYYRNRVEYENSDIHMSWEDNIWEVQDNRKNEDLKNKMRKPLTDYLEQVLGKKYCDIFGDIDKEQNPCLKIKYKRTGKLYRILMI